MITYSIERALAYQNLMRWHEANKTKFKGVSRHDADWLLVSLVIGAMPSDLMQPTPTELTAAEILRLICAIETSIETGEARKLFDGIPEIITLANYLKLSVETLEQMTECYPVSIKDKTTIEHYATNTADTPAAKVEAAPDTRPMVADEQNHAILAWLDLNGYDLKKLPVAEKGKSGIRKECGDGLREDRKKLFYSKKVFDTAWQRLRDNGQIKDAK